MAESDRPVPGLYADGGCVIDVRGDGVTAIEQLVEGPCEFCGVAAGEPCAPDCDRLGGVG